jgi:hypothetical protein
MQANNSALFIEIKDIILQSEDQFDEVSGKRQ